MQVAEQVGQVGVKQPVFGVEGEHRIAGGLVGGVVAVVDGQGGEHDLPALVARVDGHDMLEDPLAGLLATPFDQRDLGQDRVGVGLTRVDL